MPACKPPQNAVTSVSWRNGGLPTYSGASGPSNRSCVEKIKEISSISACTGTPRRWAALTSSIARSLDKCTR